ncbi:HAD-IIB family hydrolase [Mycoplasmopsis opalescens]|uniref:HAD-IIB family hydrolase n=1 Tax=Mycoplasmopsis opalescens TaxID=114886 RepID=UPI0004A765DA|nr:HAD-IIB family hydrolase [Mycoplasmopsis opalescens]
MIKKINVSDFVFNELLKNKQIKLNLISNFSESDFNLKPNTVLLLTNLQTDKKEYFKFKFFDKASKTVFLEKYKLKINDFDNFVFDMDGTLLKPNKEFNMSAIEPMKKLIKKGKRVIINTGRNLWMLAPYISFLPYNEGLICANGGMIHDYESNQIIHMQEIETDIVWKIMQKLKELDFAYFLHHDKGFAANNTDKTEYFKKANLASFMGQSLQMNITYNQLKELKVAKILASFKANEIEKLNEIKDFLKQFEELEVEQTQRTMLDIGFKGVTKGSSYVWYANKFNLDLAKTMAFGDAVNDIKLFDLVGFSATPNDAMQRAKDESSFTSNLTSSEDWILDFFNRYN